MAWINSNRKILKYTEDRANFWRALLSFPILCLPAITGFQDNWLGFFYCSVIWFLLSDTNFLLHQHVHLRLSTSRTLNGILDIMMSMTTGMSAYNWRQHHVLRHHRGNDDWEQPYQWEAQQYSWWGALIYSLRKTFIMYLYPLGESFFKGIILNHKRPIIYRAAFLEQIFIFLIMASFIMTEPLFYGWYYFLVYFFTSMADYENHVGCNKSPYGFSNNNTNHCYNWVRNNFGYHTAHHFFPKAHWTCLPKLHKTLNMHIPGTCMQSGWWTGIFTPPLVVYLFLTKITSWQRLEG